MVLELDIAFGQLPSDFLHFLGGGGFNFLYSERFSLI
jgi:hypothetical protein